LNRKIVISLFFLVLFLTWLFCGIYFSTGEEWWTALYIEQTSEDTFVGRVSAKRVLIGVLASTLLGLILYIITRKS
jgi:hypothetical protein